MAQRRGSIVLTVPARARWPWLARCPDGGYAYERAGRAHIVCYR